MKRRRNTRPALKQGPLVALTHGVLLFLALFGTVFSFSTAFSLEIQALWVLLFCGVWAVLFLIVFSLPRFRWLILLIIVGLCALAVWRLWDTLVLGEIPVRCAVVNTFAESLGTFETIHPIAQLPQETWTAASTLFICAVALPLAGLHAFAIVRRRSILLLLLFSLPVVALPIAVTVTPGWLPLMALLCVWCAMALTSLAGRHDPNGSIHLTWVTLPACAALLLLLTVVMPMDSYQRPEWADRANNTLTNWLVRISDRFLRDGESGTLAAANSDVDLSSAGPLDYSGRTVLRVETDLRGRIYLRGFAAGVYEDNQWKPFDQEVYDRLLWEAVSMDEANTTFIEGSNGKVSTDEADITFIEGSNIIISDNYISSSPSYQSSYPSYYSSYFIPSLNGYQPLNFPALADRYTFGHKYVGVTVENLGADPGYVYHPYQLLTTPEQVNGAQFVYDGWLGREDGVWTHTFYVMPQCAPLSGATLSDEAAQAEWNYRSFVYSHYLDVPYELWDTLQNCLMDIFNRPGHVLSDDGLETYHKMVTSDFENTEEIALVYTELIADYLDQLAEYNPDTPVTPAGKDFVDYFLTESHEGYCMHFASAATLMLRTMGIPARYVTGYVADVPASGKVNVPDSNAHAWVEVYINGYGWHPVEVTPAYAGGNPGQSGTVSAPQPTTAPAPTAAPTTQPGTVVSTPAPTPTPTPGQEEWEPPFDLRLLGIPGGVAALLLALIIRRKLLLRRRVRRWADPDTNAAVIHAYRYLTRLTRWGGAIPPEAEALAKKARFSQHRLTEAERRTVLSAARTQGAKTDRKLPWWKRLAFRYLAGL